MVTKVQISLCKDCKKLSEVQCSYGSHRSRASILLHATEAVARRLARAKLSVLCSSAREELVKDSPGRRWRGVVLQRPRRACFGRLQPLQDRTGCRSNARFPHGRRQRFWPSDKDGPR